VLYGRREIGNVDPFVLIRKVTGTRVISLAGRGWSVSAVDWSRRRAYVEPAETRGEARWISVAQPQSYVLVDAQRRVLIGAEPAGTRLSQRAQEQLPKVRAECADRVDHDHTLVRAEGARTRWWTWAGGVGDFVLIYVGQAAAAGQMNSGPSSAIQQGPARSRINTWTTIAASALWCASASLDRILYSKPSGPAAQDSRTTAHHRELPGYGSQRIISRILSGN
jgi:hypothetical protein